MFARTKSHGDATARREQERCRTQCVDTRDDRLPHLVNTAIRMQAASGLDYPAEAVDLRRDYVRSDVQGGRRAITASGRHPGSLFDPSLTADFPSEGMADIRSGMRTSGPRPQRD
jgi:hypothetical protein